MRACLVALLLLLATPALAQDAKRDGARGEILKPPRGRAAQAYLDHAGRRVSTDARYLSADAPIDLRRSTLREGARFGGGEGAARLERDGLATLLGWVALLAVLGGLLYMLLQARYGDLFAGSGTDRKAPPRTVELADVGTADISGLSIDALARMDDPREALRLLLIHALSRAAHANSIALRRSFTARDVLTRVPRTWRLRDLLEAIVRRGEVVLFGGRPFTRDDLATVLEASQPMFAPTSSGGRR